MKSAHLLPFIFASSLVAHPALDIKAGPIWNNHHAHQICPLVCADADLSWNGNWHTTIWGEMSVCSCANSLNGSIDQTRQDSQDNNEDR